MSYNNKIAFVEELIMKKVANEEIFTIDAATPIPGPKPTIRIVDLTKLNTLTHAWEKYTSNDKEDSIFPGNKKVRILDQDDVSCWNGLYGVFVLIVCIVMSSFYILIPQHNVIESPEFWYESLFVNVFGWWTLYGTQKVFDGGMILGCPYIISWKVITNLFLTSAITYAILHCLIYLFWSVILHYNHPMPFHCLIAAYVTAVIVFVRLWFTFPKCARKNSIFRRQLKAFLGYNLWIAIAIYLQLSIILTKVFIKIPQDLQWTMAIFVPLIKNFDDSVSKILIDKASGTDKVASRTVVNIFSSATFSFWMVIMLGTTATDFTSVCFLGVNSIMNIGLCIKTIRLQRKIDDEIKGTEESPNSLSCKETLTELITNEIIEILVPFAFVFTYSIAYYGPNSDILGNIGNDYWHFTKIEDITPLIRSTLAICLMDFASTIISAILLWKCCRIHLMDEVYSVFRRYWHIIAIHAAINVNKVFMNKCSLPSLLFRFRTHGHNIHSDLFDFQFYYSLMIANGMDLTRQFAWINNDEERIKLLAGGKLENLTYT